MEFNVVCKNRTSCNNFVSPRRIIRLDEKCHIIAPVLHTSQLLLCKGRTTKVTLIKRSESYQITPKKKIPRLHNKGFLSGTVQTYKIKFAENIKFISFPYVQITFSFAFSLSAQRGGSIQCEWRTKDKHQKKKKKTKQKVTFFKIQLNPIAFLPRMFTYFSPKQWLIQQKQKSNQLRGMKPEVCSNNNGVCTSRLRNWNSE